MSLVHRFGAFVGYWKNSLGMDPLAIGECGDWRKAPMPMPDETDAEYLARMKRTTFATDETPADCPRCLKGRNTPFVLTDQTNGGKRKIPQGFIGPVPRDLTKPTDEKPKAKAKPKAS